MKDDPKYFGFPPHFEGLRDAINMQRKYEYDARKGTCFNCITDCDGQRHIVPGRKLKWKKNK